MAQDIAGAPPQPDAGEEDDYLSMTFAEPPKTVQETSIQRTARLKREAQARSRPRSKAEIAAEESAARDAALATSLDSSNKGYKMLAKLGFKGGALGKDYGSGNVRSEPIRVTIKEDRSGVGLESEKKRKFREDAEKEVKRVKAVEGDQVDYRERLRHEREEKRLDGQIIGAQAVCERLTEADEQGKGRADGTAENDRPTRLRTKPLVSINVLWRGSARHRLQRERERRARYDLHQSLSSLPTYEDADEDRDYKHAFGTEEEELDEEDVELDEFNSLEPEVRLARLVDHLRDTWRYCFWCKFVYPDASLEGCPGKKEEDHD